MITIDVKVPDDASRLAPFRQPFLDLVARAPRSDWMRHVAHARVFMYDRVRQYLARLGLAALIACAYLLLPEVRGWAWALLVLPFVQGSLELHLEPRVREARLSELAEETGGRRIDDALTRVVLGAYEKRWLNATGVIGAFAATANVFAVALGTGADERTAWIKVAAFSCAMLYAVSALSGPLLEATTYSPLAQNGFLMRRLRWAIWPVLGVVAAGVVAYSDVRLDAWPNGAVPYAYLACTIAYALGLRLREHDRLALAAGLVTKKSDLDVGDHISRQLHELVQFYKGSLDEVLDLDEVDAGDKARLRAFLLNIEHIYAKQSTTGISVRDSLLPDPATVVRLVAAPLELEPDVAGIVLPDPVSGRAVRTPDDGPSGESATFMRENYEFAKLLISTLTHNAVQAYGRHPGVVHRPLTVTAVLEGDDVVVAVADGLPPISASDWLVPGSNLARLSVQLRERQGTIEQVATDDGKRIIARWKNVPTDLFRLDRVEGGRTW